MNTTILLSARDTHVSINKSKTLFVLIGVWFLLSGLSNLFQGPIETSDIFRSVLGVAAGSGFLMHAVIALNANHKWSPKVIINDKEILIRNSLFGKDRIIPLEQIKQITFCWKTLAFLFHDDHTELVKVRTNFDTYVVIKDAVIDTANQKGIELEGI